MTLRLRLYWPIIRYLKGQMRSIPACVKYVFCRLKDSYIVCIIHIVYYPATQTCTRPGIIWPFSDFRSTLITDWIEPSTHCWGCENGEAWRSRYTQSEEIREPVSRSCPSRLRREFEKRQKKLLADVTVDRYRRVDPVWPPGRIRRSLKFQAYREMQNSNPRPWATLGRLPWSFALTML